MGVVAGEAGVGGQAEQELLQRGPSEGDFGCPLCLLLRQPVVIYASDVRQQLMGPGQKV